MLFTYWAAETLSFKPVHICKYEQLETVHKELEIVININSSHMFRIITLQATICNSKSVVFAHGVCPLLCGQNNSNMRIWVHTNTGGNVELNFQGKVRGRSGPNSRICLANPVAIPRANPALISIDEQQTGPDMV